MTSASSPLFFPQVLNEPGSHTELGKQHSLSSKDFSWLGHIHLATDARRQALTPPMSAERLLLKVKGKPAVGLAGCFMLSATPDDSAAILYTPYGGIEKFDTVELLQAELVMRLSKQAERDVLLRFLSNAQRTQLDGELIAEVTHEIMQDGIFEDQKTVIEANQQHNALRLLEQLVQLPLLPDLLNEIFADVLRESFAQLPQSQTRVSFVDHSQVKPVVEEAMSLSDALLLFYRHQGWPAGQTVKFSNAQRKAADADQEIWHNAVRTVAAGLSRLLGKKLQAYWNHLLPNGQTRLILFSQAMSDKARADILFKRQESIITPGQARGLEVLFERSAAWSASLPLIPEAVRLWEYPANYVELAGSFMIANPDAYLFTPVNGLQLLEDHKDLVATVRAKFSSRGHEDELYELLTQQERNLFLGFDQPQVSGEPITGPVFDTLLDRIVAKQLQNVEYALGVFRNSDGLVNMAALFDKALDVRSLIDAPLTALPTRGRWSTSPIITGQSHPSIVLADKAVTAGNTFESVRLALEVEWMSQLDETSAEQRTSLESLKPKLAHAMAVGILGEARMRVLNRSLSASDVAIVDSVLATDQPTRAGRKALNGFRPDAYWFSLEKAGSASSLMVAHCFLLTERGGLDEQHSGRALLWTPALGLEAFKSVATARRALQRRLLDPVKRLGLIENVLATQRGIHTLYTLGQFRLIEGSVPLHRQQSAIEHFLASCEQVRYLKLPQAKTAHALNDLKRQPLSTNLQRARSISEAIATQQSLPAWLGNASLLEQQKHIEILQQHGRSVIDGKDYLHGIKTLAVYVHEQLIALQKTRFNGLYIDPDDIKVTPALAIAGPAQSLTEFALNHINLLQGTSFTLASSSRQALPEGMTPGAVRQLLLQLNIKSVYGQLLSQQLSGDSDDARARKLRYFRQMPWQLLQEAHALKLQEQLSASAFDAIQQLLDMPNATARAAVEGANAIIRPLELISTAGATPVATLGMYLISPGKDAVGPQVLYAPYFVGSPFTEFASETSLVAALNRPGPLQDLLLRRLPESSRSTFRNLFTESLGGTTEITLADNPIPGNVLERLFQDNILLLKQMLGCQSTPTAQTDWEKAKQLFSSGIHLVVSCLPGKLSCLLFLWQAYKDFKDSAEALQDHHWKRALKSFVSGAAQMITIGRMMNASPEAISEAATAVEPSNVQTVVAPKWSTINTTSATRTAAQAYEAPTVDLEKLQKNAASNTYRDTTTTHHFAPVAGKVYRVAQHSGRWCMTDGIEKGPILDLAPGPQLVMAVDPHSVHYGKAISRFANNLVAQMQASDELNIEAQGMDEIRRHYPEKARIIVQALDIARLYALKSLHNLAQMRKAGDSSRLDTFFKSFFDIHTVDDGVLDKIRNVIVPICTALVDPGLDDLDTRRFVVGSTSSSSSKFIAFIVKRDQQKRVYFSEHFFKPELDWYKSGLTEAFDVDGHAQATTLIHEFSHHFANTIDITYLEARRPFSDLITTATAFGAKMKTDQELFEKEALSLATPRSQLFRDWNSSLSSWVSLDAIPNSYDVAKEVLRTTRTKSLSEARNAFLDHNSADVRIDTILRNADSVTRLISEMGRQLDPEPVV
ncbi:dermonecrotic toxin domain-containing protein [Pseudomonas sp. LB3P31]